MAFCENCGAQHEDDALFCPGCGQGVGADAAQPVAPMQPVQAQPIPQQPYAQAAPPAAPLSPADDVQQNKGMAILAYILFFIPLLTGAHKTSPFVKYHTNQGTVLAIAAVALQVVVAILRGILRSIFYSTLRLYSVFSILSIILSLTGLVVLVFCVIGIINASKGEQKPLPVIGKLFTIIK